MCDEVIMDKSEFTRRVTDMRDRLYRVACGMLREREDRLDALQEAVLKAWAKRDGLRNEDYFETWLTRILINECRNLQRAQRRMLPLESVPERGTDGDIDVPLRDAVLALDEKLRLVVILHYMNGYSVAEVARILRLPEGTVKTRLRKARGELKDMLGREGRAI